MKAIVAGKTFHRPLGGFVGVVNVGMETNWLGIRWPWRIYMALAGWRGIPI